MGVQSRNTPIFDFGPLQNDRYYFDVYWNITYLKGNISEQKKDEGTDMRSVKENAIRSIKNTQYILNFYVLFLFLSRSD